MRMSFEDYLRRWSALHGSYSPEASVWVRGWLRLTYVVARPLARRASPDAVTMAGAGLAVAAVGVASAGGRWALVAALLVLTVAVADSVDGAVAVLSGRASRWGFVLDSVIDRLTEAFFLVALVLVWHPLPGGPLPAVALLLAPVPSFLLEYARARAAAAGVQGIVVVTVWERPSRVIVATMVLLVAGLAPARAGVAVSAGLAVWFLLGSVSLGVLLTRVRGLLTAAGHGPPA